MLEDTQEKVRRNVVTFSAFILGTTYLGVSFAEKIGSIAIDVKNVSPVKLWSLGIVILIYLVLRYHFDTKTSEQRSEASSEFARLNSVRIRSNVTKDLQNYLTKRARPKYVLEAEAVLDDFQGILKQAGNVPPDDVKVRLDLSSFEIMRWQGSAKADIAFTYKSKNAAHAQSLSHRVQFSIPRIDIAATSIITASKLATFSKISVDLVMPYALSLAAACVCLYRLLN